MNSDMIQKLKAQVTKSFRRVVKTPILSPTSIDNLFEFVTPVLPPIPSDSLDLVFGYYGLSSLASPAFPSVAGGSLPSSNPVASNVALAPSKDNGIEASSNVSNATCVQQLAAEYHTVAKGMATVMPENASTSLLLVQELSSDTSSKRVEDSIATGTTSSKEEHALSFPEPVGGASTTPSSRSLTQHSSEIAPSSVPTRGDSGSRPSTLYTSTERASSTTIESMATNSTTAELQPREDMETTPNPKRRAVFMPLTHSLPSTSLSDTPVHSTSSSAEVCSISAGFATTSFIHLVYLIQNKDEELLACKQLLQDQEEQHSRELQTILRDWREEKAKYQEMLRSKDNELRASKRRITELEAKRLPLLRASEARVDALEHALAFSEREVKALQKAEVVLQAEVSTLQDSLKESRLALEGLRVQHIAAKELLSDIQKIRRREKKDLEREIRKLRKECVVVGTEKGRLQGDLMTIRAERRLEKMEVLHLLTDAQRKALSISFPLFFDEVGDIPPPPASEPVVNDEQPAAKASRRRPWLRPISTFRKKSAHLTNISSQRQPDHQPVIKEKPAVKAGSLAAQFQSRLPVAISRFRRHSEPVLLSTSSSTPAR